MAEQPTTKYYVIDRETNEVSTLDTWGAPARLIGDLPLAPIPPHPFDQMSPGGSLLEAARAILHDHTGDVQSAVLMSHAFAEAVLANSFGVPAQPTGYIRQTKVEEFVADYGRDYRDARTESRPAAPRETYPPGPAALDMTIPGEAPA